MSRLPCTVEKRCSGTITLGRSSAWCLSERCMSSRSAYQASPVCAADYGRPHDRKLSDDVVDLLDRIFVVDPEQRIALAGIQVHDAATL